MKAVLYVVLFYVLFQIGRSLVRTLLTPDGGQAGDRGAPRAQGEEMVQDPRCRTYVVKGRAVARRVGGRTQYFCSAACADAHERGERS